MYVCVNYCSRKHFAFCKMGKIRYGYYERTCLVPLCKSSTNNTPFKVFVSLPKGTTKQGMKQRHLWLLAMGRNPKTVSQQSDAFVCEDHFNVSKKSRF